MLLSITSKLSCHFKLRSPPDRQDPWLSLSAGGVMGDGYMRGLAITQHVYAVRMRGVCITGITTGLMSSVD